MHVASVAERWRGLAQSGAALAFQDETWRTAWYETLGRKAGAVPLAVTVVDTLQNRDVMALPLVRHKVDNLSIIEFADGGLTDYNAPILGAGAPTTAVDAEALWRTLRANLPAADVLRFTKMPGAIGAAPNPFALLSAARPSRFHGNILRVDGAWDEWHWGLERTFRKELERSSRVFEKKTASRFQRIMNAREAAHVYAQLQQIQSARA